MENGGEERSFYLKRFQEQNPQYAIQSIHVGGVQKALEARYETGAQHQRDSAGIEAQHAPNAQEVHHQAKAVGVDKIHLNETGSDKTSLGEKHHNETSLDRTQLHEIDLNKAGSKKPPPDTQKTETLQKGSSIRDAVLTKFREVDAKIEAGTERIGDKEENLQDAESASQEKTLGGAAIKNLLGSAGKGALSALEDLPTDPPLLIP